MPRHKADDTELIAAVVALLLMVGRFNERTRRWAIEETAEQFAPLRNCTYKTLCGRLHRVLPHDPDKLRRMVEQHSAERVQSVPAETALMTRATVKPTAPIISKEEIEELQRRVSDLQEGIRVIDCGYF